MSRTASFIRAVRALRRALFGRPTTDCQHYWEVIEKVKTYQGEHDARPLHIDMIQKCTKCGDLKKFRV